MEPVWRLSDSVSTTEEFSLAESFTLATAADAFIWSDFLGVPTWLYRITQIAGRYSPVQDLRGRYIPAKRLEGDA